MIEVAVIEDPQTAGVTLDPVRARLLAELIEPASAAALAAKLGQPRQRGQLPPQGARAARPGRAGGGAPQGQRHRARAAGDGGLLRHLPEALAPVQPDPARAPDRLSARWLLALAAGLLRDVGALITGAARAQMRLATFAIAGEVRFASAADRAAFAEELAGAVATLVARYHDAAAPGGRTHRVVVAVHPSVTRPPAPPALPGHAGIALGAAGA